MRTSTRVTADDSPRRVVPGHRHVVALGRDQAGEARDRVSAQRVAVVVDTYPDHRHRWAGAIGGVEGRVGEDAQLRADHLGHLLVEVVVVRAPCRWIARWLVPEPCDCTDLRPVPGRCLRRRCWRRRPDRSPRHRAARRAGWAGPARTRQGSAPLDVSIRLGALGRSSPPPAGRMTFAALEIWADFRTVAAQYDRRARSVDLPRLQATLQNRP